MCRFDSKVGTDCCSAGDRDLISPSPKTATRHFVINYQFQKVRRMLLRTRSSSSLTTSETGPSTLKQPFTSLHCQPNHGTSAKSPFPLSSTPPRAPTAHILHPILIHIPPTTVKTINTIASLSSQTSTPDLLFIIGTKITGRCGLEIEGSRTVRALPAGATTVYNAIGEVQSRSKHG